MSDLSALHHALAVYDTPGLLRRVRRSQLPEGIDVLVELAAGAPEMSAELEERTGRTGQDLRRAAAFYIEQVMLAPEADCWRILGANGPVDPASLRRRMALLLKWAHPDLPSSQSADRGFEPGLFARRITAAWEDVKSGRAARQRPAGRDALAGRPNGSSPAGKASAPGASMPRQPGQRARASKRNGAPQRYSPPSLLKRLMLRLTGRND